MQRGFLKLLLAASLMSACGEANIDPMALENRMEAPTFDFLQQHNTPANSRADQQARKLLALPPFPPKDVNLLTPQVYPASNPLVPASPRAWSIHELERLIKHVLVKRFHGNQNKVQQGLAIFHDPRVKQVIRDSRLRAGLTVLLGTIGEPAIDAVRSGVIASVSFAEITPSDAIAVNTIPPDGSRPIILFQERFQYEDPRLFASTFAHEILHGDSLNSTKEELISSSIDTLVHLKFVLENSQLVRQNTELTRRLNTKAVARLNTRDEQGDLRLFALVGNVFPGSPNPLKNFGSAFGPIGTSPVGDTPGNARLDAMLGQLTGQLISGANFDDQTVELLDHTQFFRPKELVHLARTLKLNLNPNGLSD